MEKHTVRKAERLDNGEERADGEKERAFVHLLRHNLAAAAREDRVHFALYLGWVSRDTYVLLGYHTST